MSKDDVARAEAGTIFRDGKLVSKEVYNEEKANTKLLQIFIRKPRLLLRSGDANTMCPVCTTPKPLTARRPKGVVEHFCRKCYFGWENPSCKS